MFFRVFVRLERSCIVGESMEGVRSYVFWVFFFYKVV